MHQKKRIGVLMRTFARKPEAVPKTVAKVMKALEALLRYSTRDWQVSNIIIAIPTNKKYKDSDCGELGWALNRAWLELVMSIDENALRPNVRPNVWIVEEREGDLFVGIQNFALTLFAHAGTPKDIMVTLAPSAFEAGYFSMKTVDSIVQAHNAGAKVMPVMVPEDGIDEFVSRGTAGGPITAWDLPALIEVGGFDRAAAQPKIGEENPNAGVEEIHPIVRIMQKHGRCYAPIMPEGVSFEKRVLEGEELERHQKQIATKTARQLAHAKSLGIDDLKFFADHVMPQFAVGSTRKLGTTTGGYIGPENLG